MNWSDGCKAAESTLSRGINKLLGGWSQEPKLVINFCSSRGRRGGGGFRCFAPSWPPGTETRGWKRRGARMGLLCTTSWEMHVALEQESSFLTHT